MEKRKRALYNLIVGVGGKILLMALGFVVPKLYIENYGSEVNGLLSSIAQVFSYLALLEAGIGTAATQALYKPVANGDTEKINGIMSAASRFYKRTGTLYALGVLLFALVYPLVVSSDVKDTTVFLLILLSGANGVLNYFFQAKYFNLLNAEGKNYVHISIGTAISLLTTVSKIVLLALRLDVVIVYTVYFLLALLQNLANSLYIKKHYKYLSCREKPDNAALKQSGSVLVHQISSLVFSHTDVLILTAFCDLNAVSIYVIYSMVTDSLSSILTMVFSSFTAALGLTYNEDKDRFRRYFDLFELGTWVLSFGLMAVALLLYKPFIALYTANADINYVDDWLPLLFVVAKLLSLIRMPGVTAINVAGHFDVTRGRSIAESVINIAVSLVCVYFLGIYGVLLGTIAALLYRTVDIIIYTNQRIVYRKPGHIIGRLLIVLLVSAGIVVLCTPLAEKITAWLAFLLAGVGFTGVTLVLLTLTGLAEAKNTDSIATLKKLFIRKNKV